MKRKTNSNCRRNPTKLLFKSSCKSINTYSKTYSGASQLCTKSLVLQLQKKLPKTKYYEDHGKIKRDLSIETDICIMRGYYKKKRNRFLNREAVSARSKYSNNYNEADAINEFTRDSSACGDSELTTNYENPRHRVNITSLVVNNLKKLLNEWITKYLFENNETKQKIDSVLDSILHKLDIQRNDTSSCTYTIDVDLEDQMSKPGSQSTVSRELKSYPEQSVEVITGQNSSFLTIPLCNKYLEVISTLSIPRNSQKRKTSKSLHRTKKFRYKKIVLSVNKSSKYLLTSSSLNFLTLRAKSLTKHCGTYQRNDTDVDLPNDKFLPETNTNNILVDDSILTETISRKNTQSKNLFKTNLKKIPSIYKNIYGITSGHIISYDSTRSGSNQGLKYLSEDQNIEIHGPIKEKNKIISENEQSDQLVTIDFGKQSNDVSKIDIKTKSSNTEWHTITKTNNKSRKCNIFKRKTSNYKNYQTIKSKQFTYLIKKSNNKVQKQKEFMNYFQNIFKYFSKYKGKRDIQLQIKVKICAKNENEDTKSYAPILHSEANKVSTPKENITEITALNSQNIISLLDGATSQTKYLVRETSTDILNKDRMVSNTNSQSNTNADKSKIVQEISELKGIIKSLANTADNLISNHTCERNKVKSKSIHSKNIEETLPQSIIFQNSMEKSLINSISKKPSKGVQVSSSRQRSQIRSGFKLRKEPKKMEFTASLMKKSNSYQIIASESIIKVTDMTSASKNITNEKMIDNALTCSLPQSKSLYEISTGPNKRKLFALYFDDLTRSKDCTRNICEGDASCHSSQQKRCSYDGCNGNITKSKLSCTDFVLADSNCELIGHNNSSSSVCVEIDPKCCCNKKVTIRNREGICFWEGLLYCVLLWIPVLLVSWLFYVYVIKDLINPSDTIITPRVNPPTLKLSPSSKAPVRAIPSGSLYHLLLSDLEIINFKTDMELLEETECNKRIKDDKKINILPIYTVAFTVTEIYDKSSINQETKSASSTTPKNEENFEICKSIIDEAIDVKKDLNAESGNQKNINITVSESISNGLKYIKEPDKNQHRALAPQKSKPKKCTRLVKIKNIHFKNKQPKYNINKKLESYYDRAKNKFTNSGTIQRNLYSDSILNAVSHITVLKKVLAKENLLDDMEKVSLNENYNEDRISYLSQSSDVTLTREKSISSDNSEFNNTKSIPSVINVLNCSSKMDQVVKELILPESIDPKKNISTSNNASIDTYKNENLYSTNVISVAVAQIENPSILKYKKETAATNSREKLMFKESLISSESYLSQSDTITSTSSTEPLRIHENERLITAVGISDSGVSSETLPCSQNVFDLTSESDKFVIAKTSSYFRNANLDSNVTLTPMLENNVKNESTQAKTSPKLLKSTLLDTIINVGMFPKVTKSIEDNLYAPKFNDVIIMDELRNSFPLNRLGIEPACENEYSKNVFKKSWNTEEANHQKNISLPNEETIKEIIFNRDQVEKKTCSEESRNYTPFPELWEKLTIFINMAIQKLEDSLMEKITREMKKTLDRIDEFAQSTCKREAKTSKTEVGIRKELQESIVISRMELGESKSLQCGSLDSHVLDELVQKMNLEGLKVFKCPPSKLRDRYKMINKDFFEILKPPVEPCVSAKKVTGDSLLALSSEDMDVKSNTQYLPVIVKNIVGVVKENLLVVISVPLFCFALFLVYIFLAVLVNV